MKGNIEQPIESECMSLFLSCRISCFQHNFNRHFLCKQSITEILRDDSMFCRSLSTIERALQHNSPGEIRCEIDATDNSMRRQSSRLSFVSDDWSVASISHRISPGGSELFALNGWSLFELCCRARSIVERLRQNIDSSGKIFEVRNCPV